MSLTFDDVQTSTPMRWSAFSPLRDSFSGNASRMRLLPSTRTMRGCGRVDGAEVVAEGVVGQFADGPGHLDAGRPAADDHERQCNGRGSGRPDAARPPRRPTGPAGGFRSPPRPT